MNNDHDALPLNVRQFGAAGDGQTDDSAAIQAAIDAAAAGPRQVYFPAGLYACSTIQLQPHITLTGCATWTYWYFKGSLLVLNDDRARALFDASRAKGVVIDGLALDGRHLGQGIHGILVHTNPFPQFDENGAGEDAICIDRSLVHNFSGDGIHLDGIWVFTDRHSMVANNPENGIYVHGFDGYVLDCWLSANRKAGYGADRLNASVTMTANRIEWNQTAGILIRGGNSYNITGNFFDPPADPRSSSSLVRPSRPIRLRLQGISSDGAAHMGRNSVDTPTAMFCWRAAGAWCARATP